MITSLKRIILILLAALLVAGALYTYGVGSGATERTDFGRRGDFRPEGELGEQFAEGRRPDFDREDATFSLRGILGFAQTLVPMTIIIGLGVLLSKLQATYKRWRQTRPKHG